MTPLTTTDMRELSVIAWMIALPMAAYGIVMRNGWMHLPLDVQFLLVFVAAFGGVLCSGAWIIEHKAVSHE